MVLNHTRIKIEKLFYLVVILSCDGITTVVILSRHLFDHVGR